MGIPSITLDTHSLIWYIDTNLNEKLSKTALHAIEEAEDSGIIYIPAITLLEALDLIEKGRIKLSFDVFMASIREDVAYQIIPLDEELLKAAIPLKGLEIHDRLIVATAILTNTVLVCRDRAVRAMGVNVVW